MRKIILLVIVLSLFTFYAYSDEMPTRLRFPKNCQKTIIFSDGKYCGSNKFEVWSCLKNKKQDFYLVIGKIETDVADDCSPTFVVKNVLKQENQ